MKRTTIKARIIDASDPTDRRRAARIEVELDAKVRELGSEGTEARVVNISDTGFMAQSSGAFDVGSRIWLIRARSVIKTRSTPGICAASASVARSVADTPDPS